MIDFLFILNLNIRIFLNSFKFATKTERIREFFLGFIGFVFFLSSYIISYQIVVYISNLPVIGSLFTVRILALGFLSSFLMLFFSSLIIPFSTMFEAEDLNLLFSLPLRYSSIYLNKVFLSLIRSSWMILVILVPFVVAFGVVKNFDILGYIVIIISILLKSLISSSLGIATSILLSYLFPSKKIKNVVLVLLIIFSAVVYSLFRFSQPEKLLSPQNFHEIFDYLDFLSKPVAKVLPSWWVAEIFRGLMVNDRNIVIINLIKLLLTVSFIFVILFTIFKKIFYKCVFFLMSEGKKSKLYKAPIINLKSTYFVVILKEIKTLLREPVQWIQFVIVVALSLVYLFNISRIPLEFKYVKITVSFLNLGGIMFILTAIVLRFVFVQPSLEYKTYWLIKSYPVSMEKLFFLKFLVYLPIVLLPGLVLCIVSNLVIGVERIIFVFSIAVVLFSCFVLTIAGFSLGLLFPKKEFKDIPQIETSFGGLMFVILSLCYIILSLSSIAEPARRYILNLKISHLDLLFYFFIFFMINFIYAFAPVYYAKKKFIEEY
ncbi:MAG: hypothetical protein ABDH23_00080 [Endomicrobiia bacterium]